MNRNISDKQAAQERARIKRQNYSRKKRKQEQARAQENRVGIMVTKTTKEQERKSENRLIYSRGEQAGWSYGKQISETKT